MESSIQLYVDGYGNSIVLARWQYRGFLSINVRYLKIRDWAEIRIKLKNNTLGNTSYKNYFNGW